MPRGQGRNPILEPIRQSTSQPQDNSTGNRPKQEWNATTPAHERTKEYDATTDPYCPYTRTKTFKTHIARQRQLEKLPSETLTKSLSVTAGLGISMKNMDRPLSAPEREQFPKHQVHSENFQESGVTISSEPRGNAAESQAELDILKSILNREGYLTRLAKSVKKVERKFKNEIADILDLIRIASVEVVEAIGKWREIKRDPDCAFMWNGINYLLKMPSDLDYLADYKAISDWLGFPIIRNPCCVPYAMEEGARLFAGSLMQANIQDPGDSSTVSPADGFSVGGASASSKLRNRFPSSRNGSSRRAGNGGVGSPYKARQQEASQIQSGVGSCSAGTPATKGTVQSFVPNNEMTRIRIAEKMILGEEAKYGRLDRDPRGRIVPEEQAYMKHLSLNMKKDERRDMAESAHTRRSFAPHVKRSGVGFADPPWYPSEGQEEEGEQAMPADDGESTIDSITRNRERIGGALSKIVPTSGSSRTHKPLHPNHGNEIEFKNSRKKKSTGDRLAEITALKEKIVMEKALLEQSQAEIDAMSSQTKVKKSRGKKRKEKEKPAFSEQDLELQRLQFEEDALKREKMKADSHGASISNIKAVHRDTEVKERSRDIERKRRLLSDEEAKRKGPPGDEPDNGYDFYATRAQTMVRQWLAIRFVKWYRHEAHRASKLIQTRVRGMCARVRVKRLRKERKAATEIQRNFRGMSSRMASAAMARDYRDAKAAVQIQKIWRRIMALKRVVTKRILDDAAVKAMECVNARNLFPMDVKELAGKIQLALNEPHANELPPDEVLHLLRMASVLLIAGEGASGITSYDHIGSRFHVETDGRNLSWEQAMKLVNRSNKYLRRVRALAYAPVAKPPRLISLPEDVVALFKSQARNPKWCVETFETMGRGSKFCVQLFKWLISMINVAQAQTKFFDFIGDKFPDWLPKMFEVQKKARKCEFDIAINERCISMLQQAMDAAPDDMNLQEILQGRKDQLVIEKEGSAQKLKSYNKREDQIGDDQAAVETMTLKTMSDKLESKEIEVRECAQEYLQLVKYTQDGDCIAEGKLPDSRDRLTTLRVEVKELRIQHGMLLSQVESNQQRRRDRKPLTAEVLVRVNLAGEAKALLIIATAKKEVLLLERGIRSENGLHRQPDAAAIYQDLCYNEKQRKNEFRSLLKQADDELVDMNYHITSEIFKREEDEKTERTRFIPTEAEMEEERLEDDKEAMAERFAKLMYISSDVMYDAPERQRPVILAFSRDVPGFSKEKLISEITAQLPGMFVRIDCDGNMGLNLNDMQAVLDAKKSIIMSVDHGLTKTTRSDFIKNYAMVTRCLVPRPYSVFVLGEDGNARQPTGDPRYGVHARDIHESRDADVKLSMERMAYVLQQLLTSDIRTRMEQRAAMIVPPSPAYIICLEALFIAQSNHTRFRYPEDNIAAISYRATQTLLQDPYGLVSVLKQMKRGKADFELCEILRNYINHRSWPGPHHPERKEDPLLNLLATYAEDWTMSETLTLQRGGLPDISLFKNAMERVQSVITLGDVTDGDDVMNSVKRSGWKTPVTQILKGILYEMRVAKTVRKIDNQMYNINVYRDAGQIFFDAYDAATSQSFVTSISMYDIPSLLVPNALTEDMSSQSTSLAPPSTPKEMYMRLVKLLRFQKAIKLRNGRKELLCRRENKFISHLTTKICGHSIMMKCFEAALGEIYFEAYLPEYSAKLVLQVDDALRLRMLANCDTQLEYHMMETEVSVDLLPYVLDRLRITPSKPVAMAKRVKPQGNSALTAKHANQGFNLILNCKGGPGRFLTKRIVTFADIPHVIALRSSTVTKTLRVISYEPRTQTTSELRFSAFVRKVLLGAVDEDYHTWFPKLVKRLKLDFKKSRALKLDLTMYRCVVKIAKRRLILSVDMIDDKSLLLDFLDPVLSDHFRAIVKKTDLIDLMHYSQDDIIGEEASSGGIVSAVKDILRYMLGTKITTAAKFDKANDPTIYDIPMEDLLTNQQCMAHVAKQMQFLVERVNPVDIRGGYLCRIPVRILFDLVASSVDRDDEDDNSSVITQALTHMGTGTLPPQGMSRSLVESSTTTMETSLQLTIEKPRQLDTVLRYTHRLVPKPRGGTLEDVLARRAQPRVIYMEEALNDLALAQHEAAKRKALEDKMAAEYLHQQLTVVDDNDDVNVTLNVDDDATLETADDVVKKPYEEEGGEDKDDNDDEGSGISEDMSIGTDEEPQLTPEEKSEQDEPKPEIPVIAEQPFPSEEPALGNRMESDIGHEKNYSEEMSHVESEQNDLVEGPRVAALPPVELFAAEKVLDSITTVLEEKHAARDVERKAPGTMLKKHLSDKATREPQKPVEDTHEPLKEIKISEEKCVFERGIKTTFREGTARWHGHVSVTVYESKCWDGSEGVGRRLRFVVYESKTATYYEGSIRSSKHLREVLGKTAQDLLPSEKTTEMLLFVSRHRLEVVRNSTTWDGVPVTNSEAPYYRIEFKSDRLYDMNKVTPANVGGSADQAANDGKLIDNAHSRGRKILRAAKRVNGLLLQLVVFELPLDGKIEAKMSEEERLAKKIKEEEENEKNKPAVRSQMKKRESMNLFEAPPLRVVGYDPRSKKRAVLIVPSDAVTEIAGGSYSQYLEPERRRELGRIVAESLELSFPRGGGFDLVVPWSGAKNAATGAVATGKTSWRSSAERVLQRPGKIFRSAVRITNYDILVSVYVVGMGSDGSMTADNTIIVNFYSSTVSESSEIRIPEDVQVAYLGQPVMSFLQGDTRAIAIRNLCKFFHADIYEDPGDSTKKVLEVELMPKRKGFVSDYKDIGLPRPEDDLRAVGVPQVFMPPDATGKMLFRKSTRVFVEELDRLSDVEYLVSIYTKSQMEGAERGIVAKVYDPEISQTIVLHYGPQEVMRLCDAVDQNDLLRDIVTEREFVTDGPKDELEEGFITLTEKGESLEKMNKLTSILSDIIVKDLGVTTNSQGQRALYSRSSEYEPK